MVDAICTGHKRVHDIEGRHWEQQTNKVTDRVDSTLQDFCGNAYAAVQSA